MDSKFAKYPKYKPSGVEWIGEIPEGWTLNRLKIHLESEQNGVWGEEEKGDANDKICIRVADFDREFDKLNKNDNTVRNIKPQDFEKRTLIYGDLLIEKSGGGELTPVGRVGYFDWNNVQAVCANFMARLRLKEQNDSRYFFFLFKALYKNGLNLKSIKQTTGIQNLDTYSYFSEQIATPLNGYEQTAIANFLDDKTAKIDTLIEKKKKLIELLKEERTAVINQAVTRGLPAEAAVEAGINPNVKLKDSGISWLGEIPEHWELKKLKYVVSKVGSGITPRGGANVYQIDGIPLLRSQNIYNDGLRLDDVAFISEEIDEEMNNSRIFENDVLLNITGASIGRCFYIPKGFGKGNVNQHVCIIRPQLSKILTEYLHIILISGYGQALIDFCQNGANREGLNFQQIRSFELPLPDKKEQSLIFHHIETETKRIDSTISKIEKEIELLAEYRTALISEVVTGKIDIRNAV